MLLYSIHHNANMSTVDYCFFLSLSILKLNRGRQTFKILCQMDFTLYHRARPDKLSYDDLMIGFCGIPEREGVEKLATRHKVMKVFEAAKTAAALKNKGVGIQRERAREKQTEMPKLEP